VPTLRTKQHKRQYLWRHVAISPETGCWEIQLYRNEKGYGRVHVNRGAVYAHRLAYEVFVGPTGDMFVRHKCDNPCCCNPAHLCLGTQADNLQDASGRGRLQTGPNHYTNRQPEKRLLGPKNPMSRLAEEQVRLIKHYLAVGATCKELAKRFAVCRQTIGDIKTGKTWSHVWPLSTVPTT